MATITPQPPGYAVEFDSPPPARFADPGTDNAFVVAFADRGTIAQAADIGALDAALGARTNYSNGRDLAATMLAVGARTVTFARVVGPGATAARLDLSDGDRTDPRTAGTLTVKWQGASGAGLKAEVVDVSGARRIIVTEGARTLAVSPTTTDFADLNAWTAAQDVVTAAFTRLPAAVSARSFTGGTDDRANVTSADWVAALDSLDRRYGPGVLIVDSTDDAVHQAALAHGAEFNREVLLFLAPDATQSDAETYALGMQADAPDNVKIGGVFKTWCWTTPVAGEPQRFVPYAAVQGGLICRNDRERGLRAPPFGVTNGAAPGVTRLHEDLSDDDRHELYVAGVNIATDDGFTIATWGYRTLDLDPLHDDLHHRHVRVKLKWRAEQIAKRFIGPPINPRTQADYHGELEAMCKAFADDEAIAAYLVDVDGVNTPETAAARERHAVIYVRHTETSDWVTVTIPVLPTT